MPKTVTQTVRDFVATDIRLVRIQGALDDPDNLRIFASVQLVDDATGDPAGMLSFEVSSNAGTRTALSNILQNNVLADANAALQARGAADVKIPPV